MGKYIKNGLAYVRAMIYKSLAVFRKDKKIGNRVRIFLSASFDISKGGKITLGNDTKIRERAYVSVRKGACFTLGKAATVGMDCKIVCHENIEIGEDTLLSPNVLIYDHDHVFNSDNGVLRKEFKSSPISIGRNCWIGANTVILKGTKIGDNCVIGAGAVLCGTYPDKSIVVQKRQTSVIPIQQECGQ